MSKLTKDSLNDTDFKAFKDGVTDALLYGVRDDEQSDYYYKQGYDFGIALYSDITQEDVND
tara:strand:- start:463 stop:645 length:183 start_codon:yes stop_codon:yes gene_type:complete